MQSIKINNLQIAQHFANSSWRRKLEIRSETLQLTSKHRAGKANNLLRLITMLTF